MFKLPAKKVPSKRITYTDVGSRWCHIKYGGYKFPLDNYTVDRLYWMLFCHKDVPFRLFEPMMVDGSIHPRSQDALPFDIFDSGQKYQRGSRMGPIFFLILKMFLFIQSVFIVFFNITKPVQKWYYTHPVIWNEW